MSNALNFDPEMPPITRFVLLVLWQAQVDGATDLIFGIPRSDGSGTVIRYKVKGTWYEMAPFPSHMRPSVIADLERMATVSQSVREGVIDRTVGGIRLRWRVQMSAPEAECILTAVSA